MYGYYGEKLHINHFWKFDGYGEPKSKLMQFFFIIDWTVTLRRALQSICWKCTNGYRFYLVRSSVQISALGDKTNYMEVLKCVTLNHKIMNNPVKFTSFIAKSFLKQKSKKPYFTCKSNKNNPIIYRKIFNTWNS